MQNKPHIVIIGAGFGGLSAVKSLSNENVNMTIIDRHNYHLFQPLLYQVATASLSPQDIASPIRSVLSKHKNVNVLLDSVTGVDTNTKKVILKEHKEVNYDYLVIAAGAKHSYFGNDTWETHAPSIKNIDDAILMRRKILLAFEYAEMEQDLEKRRAHLTFAIIGAGPTGVELAGAVAELANNALAEDFRNISPKDVKIMLIDAAPRILTTFPEKLANTARQKLERLNIEIITEAFVSHIDEECIRYGETKINTRTVLWCAGVQASSASKWLDIEPASRAGHIAVTETCQINGIDDHIYAVGDTVLYPHTKTGKPLPGVASVAKQQGAFVGKHILSRIKNTPAPVFKYKDYGNLATVGRNMAIADFGVFQMKGLIGWLLWVIVHIYFLIGFRQRFIVALHWAWQYITFKRGVRLITYSASASPRQFEMEDK